MAFTPPAPLFLPIMSEEALRPTPAAAAEGTPVSTPAQSAVIVQILSTVLFTFLAYMTIGIPLAVLPGYVHLDLGYSSFIARAQAGRMVDTIGPKKTVMRGMLACIASGAFLILAAWSAELPWLSLTMILISRFCLGIGESLVGTGAIIWGIGRIGAAHTARMISWNGIAIFFSMVLRAPLGVALEHVAGFSSIGFVALALPLIGYL